MEFTNDDQRRAAVEALIPIVQRMCATSLDMLRKTLIREPDDLGFMALAFVTKQLEHARSVIALIRDEQHRDAEAISRFMLEGMALLVWASRKPESRPRMWRAYALIDDFRTLQARTAGGLSTPEAFAKLLNAQLEEHGEQFLSSKGRAARDARSTLPRDPYRQRWHHENGKRIELEDIFAEIGTPDLHGTVYEQTSQWIHWTPRGVGQTLEHTETEVRVEARSWRSATGALMSAFHSMRECMLVVNAHWNLDFAAPISTLLRNAMDSVNPTRKPGSSETA